MDAKEFVNLASRLQASSGPAEYRSAVSRAYYAAFLTGREHLKRLVPLPKDGKAHAFVNMILLNCGDDPLRQAGSSLGDLRIKRNRADYELDRVDIETVREAGAAVAEATQIISVIEAQFASGHATVIGKAVQQYWTGTLGNQLGGIPPIP